MQDYVGKQIDRYRITERLGMGGMAVVYKAYDTRLERDVALKLIRTTEIPESQHTRMMMRFEREAKAQARFDHKHIVHVYDCGEVDDSPYLVMAYIPGGTLKARTGKPIPYQQSIRWLIPIADALSYANEFGVIHRDIKPSNILFDSKDQPILTDFGIAKILETDEATLTGTGLGVGTPEYMAPEQWQGKAFPNTDQYSLGVVLYELLTGEKPYQADTPAAVAIMQATEPLRMPSALVPGIPESVEKLLYKALARQPHDRYADMSAFRKALEKQLAVETAEPVKPVETVKPAPTLVPPHPKPVPGSEAETVDILEQTPVDVPRQPTNSYQSFRSEEKKSQKRPSLPDWALEIGLVLFVWVIMTGVYLLNKDRGGTPVATIEHASTILQVDSPTPTNSIISAPTIAETSLTLITPTEANTPAAAATPERTLSIGSTMINPADGAVMVYVPEGEFLMGSKDEDAWDDEKPEHLVYLDAFWIYKTEVTNDQYSLCVAENVCSKPKGTLEFDSSRFRDYPVISINWYQAQTYCEWVGGRLPTEAEWEKTARGNDERKYPWGNQNPTCSLGNFYGCGGGGGTSPVGSYSGDISPYSALDMAGNVSEWVLDWYNPNYFSNAPYENPTGPVSGIFRGRRGSDWLNENVSSVWNRLYSRPDDSGFHIGFRCILGNAH